MIAVFELDAVTSPEHTALKSIYAER